MRYRDGLREDPPEQRIAALLHETLDARYETVKWEIPDDFMQYTHFQRVLEDLELKSSPGYPLMRQYASNKELLGVKDDKRTYDPVRVNMVWEMINRRLKDRTSDPIRLFVKPEPITKKKVAQGRNRLISSVSVIDQLIDAMLFGEMNKKIHDNHHNLASKVGWSPYVGGWKTIPRGWVATDKSAWDWTATMWLAQECLEARRRLCTTQGPKLSQWYELAVWRYKKLYERVEFVTSLGMRFKAMFSGVVKSGSYNTIDDNTMMQEILHIRTCLEIGNPITAQFVLGDDVLQEKMPNPRKYYNHLSQFCVLKEVITATEFAGHRFKGPIVEPLSLIHI